MKVAVTGASGLVGTALLQSLAEDSHSSVKLVRTKPNTASELQWDPLTGNTDQSALEQVDAVVHLAGENIAEGRWTDEKKSRIRQSRVVGTRNLSETIAALQKQPKAFVCASAVGFYGDRGDEILSEDSPSGEGFLAEVCREWESASDPAERAGIRTVRLRIGVVLSRAGGALPKMLTPFKLGIGGKIGPGSQYMSWITRDDLVSIIRFVLKDDSVRGAVNAVSPNPVTNLRFTKALGQAVSRPAILPMPAFAARLVLGHMADELLLASQRVKPVRLLDRGFEFKDTEIEAALVKVLRR
jgi:uncharacterized protein (TIGR01777 family)